MHCKNCKRGSSSDLKKIYLSQPWVQQLHLKTPIFHVFQPKPPSLTTGQLIMPVRQGPPLPLQAKFDDTSLLLKSSHISLQPKPESWMTVDKSSHITLPYKEGKALWTAITQENAFHSPTAVSDLDWVKTDADCSSSYCLEQNMHQTNTAWWAPQGFTAILVVKQLATHPTGTPYEL